MSNSEFEGVQKRVAETTFTAGKLHLAVHGQACLGWAFPQDCIVGLISCADVMGPPMIIALAFAGGPGAEAVDRYREQPTGLLRRIRQLRRERPRRG